MPANLLLRDTHPPVAPRVHSITPMTLRVVAQASRSESACDIMSPELVSAPESLAIVQTIELMCFKGVRRVPVVNSENHLVGIVTIHHLLAVLAGALAGIAHVVSREHLREGRVRQ